MQLVVNDYSTGYNGMEVLHNISFDITENGIYVILGQNGSGKTTLFRGLTGLLNPYSGYIKCDGIDLRKSNVNITYLTHTLAIPVGLTVLKILNFFSEIEGEDHNAVEQVAKRLDLTSILNTNTQNLSQGQKKRVSLAKSLLKNPDMFIFDEPTTSLDPIISSEIRNIMREEAKSKIILYSSHNLYEANDLGNRVILLKEGKLAYNGKITDVHSSIYRIGIRGIDIEKAYPDAKKEGQYYIVNLNDPSEVSGILAKLVAFNIRVYEIKEMSNPLEELYGKIL